MREDAKVIHWLSAELRILRKQVDVLSRALEVPKVVPSLSPSSHALHAVFTLVDAPCQQREVSLQKAISLDVLVPCHVLPDVSQNAFSAFAFRADAPPFTPSFESGKAYCSSGIKAGCVGKTQVCAIENENLGTVSGKGGDDVQVAHVAHGWSGNGFSNVRAPAASEVDPHNSRNATNPRCLPAVQFSEAAEHPTTSHSNATGTASTWGSHLYDRDRQDDEDEGEEVADDDLYFYWGSHLHDARHDGDDDDEDEAYLASLSHQNDGGNEATFGAEADEEATSGRSSSPETWDCFLEVTDLMSLSTASKRHQCIVKGLGA